MAVLVVLAIVASFANPRELSAHGALKRSAPAAKSQLAVAPVDLRLTFNEPPVLAFTKITLTGPDGAVRLGALRVDSLRTVVALIEGALAAGRYTVAWQIAGKDGHPVRGTFAFTILPGATGLNAAAAVAPGDSTHGEAASAVVAPGSDTLHTEHHLPEARAFDASSPLFVLIRWLWYLEAFAVIGAVAFRFVVLPRYARLAVVDAGAGARVAPFDDVAGDAARRAATLGAAAAALLIAATMLRLAAQLRAVHGGLGDVTSAIIGGTITSTVWGWGWLLQLVMALVAAVALWSARRGGIASRAWYVALVVGVVLAFTPALAGHAIASPSFPALAVVSDGLHVIGASGWIGSLAILVFAGMPAALTGERADREAIVANLVNAFSPTALAFAALVVLSGVLASWLHVRELSALWETDYGKALLWKLGLLTFVIGIGGYNFLRVRPTLGRAPGAMRMRRNASVEVAVAAIVLLITAVLVATPTPAERDTATQAPSAESID